MGPNFGVFPLEQTRHVGVAKSERPRLTNGYRALVQSAVTTERPNLARQQGLGLHLNPKGIADDIFVLPVANRPTVVVVLLTDTYPSLCVISSIQ